MAKPGFDTRVPSSAAQMRVNQRWQLGRCPLQSSIGIRRGAKTNALGRSDISWNGLKNKMAQSKHNDPSCPPPALQCNPPKPSHLPTLPVQRHMPCPRQPHLIVQSPIRLRCRAVSATCQHRWRGDPRGACSLLFCNQGQGCYLDVLRISRSKARSHMGYPGRPSSPATPGGMTNTALPVPVSLNPKKDMYVD